MAFEARNILNLENIIRTQHVTETGRPFEKIVSQYKKPVTTA